MDAASVPSLSTAGRDRREVTVCLIMRRGPSGRWELTRGAFEYVTPFGPA